MEKKVMGKCRGIFKLKGKQKMGPPNNSRSVHEESGFEGENLLRSQRNKKKNKERQERNKAAKAGDRRSNRSGDRKGLGREKKKE